MSDFEDVVFYEAKLEIVPIKAFILDHRYDEESALHGSNNSKWVA